VKEKDESTTVTTPTTTNDSSDNSTTTDTTAPVIAEVTAVTTPTNDTTPAYTFSSTEAGTITYGGSCTSSTTSASSGNNAITFSTLSNGTYDNCTVTVTDNASNSSSNLPVSTFTVDNTTISSLASDNATVTFGQSYQYQLTTSSTYSGTITYSLSNEPDNMTISASGLIEWTPSKKSDIDNSPYTITITLTTASGYVLTQTYDFTVTGTCTSGNVMSIWAGDQRTSTDSSKFIKNITAYTDNSSSVKTASQNYNYSGSSVNLTHGPTPTATTGNVFFYNQYDNTTHLYLFYMFGVKGNSSADTINIDIFTDNNSSTDAVVVADDNANEIGKQSSGCGSSDACYKGRHAYNSANSGSSFDLSDNESDWYPVDNFTVGYNTTLDCSN